VSVYLDYHATAPLRPEARAAMEPWLTGPWNPSSVHASGRRAAAALERARGQVAGLVGWPVGGVVFTSGASESNATALQGGRWAGAAVEHPSVRAHLTTELPVDGDGRLRLDALRAWLADAGDATGVAIQYANHETGVLQPVEAVLALVRAANETRSGAPLRVHVDAAQAAGKVPLELGALVCGRSSDWGGPDTLTLSAHKLGGLPGVGALLVAPGREVTSLVRGGAQERGRRAGTPPVYAAVAFGAAAAAADEPREPLQGWFEAELAALGAQVVGGGAPRLPTVTCAVWPGVDAADLVMALDLEGVATSAGAACASGSVGPSPVLRAMGIDGSGVRYSWGRATPRGDLERALDATRRVLARLVFQDPT